MNTYWKHELLIILINICIEYLNDSFLNLQVGFLCFETEIFMYSKISMYGITL